MNARRLLVESLGLVLVTTPSIPPAVQSASSIQSAKSVESAKLSFSQERPNYQATATAVLVDVVVRDRHGKPVTDLKAEDFELREDGVVQPLGSFTRVSRGGGIGVRVGLKEPGTRTFVEHGRPEASDPSTPSGPTYPAVTALVFDALSADAISLCQRAALEYVPMSGLFDARVAVFSTEPSMRVLQGFTDDPALVRKGVRQVLPAGTALKESQSERMAKLRERRDQLHNLADPGAQAGAGGASLGGGNATAIGETEVQKRLVQGEMRALQAFDTLDREQRGFSTTGAISTVLQSLAEMPGRKTLVFFSEGLPASPVLQARLQSVVEAANRINVTIYAVDASGLRTLSGTRETRMEVEEAGKERLRQSDSTTEPTDQPVMRIIERTEDLVRYDSQSGLARMAEETGGFLFRDSNDLRRAFTRIDEDMRFHYLLTYSPAKQTFDGNFRAIGVKVRRPGVEVFARKGYRALRHPPAPVSLDYETPALAALEAPRLAQGFPFTSVALSFPERSRPGLAPLLVRVATGHLTYRENPQQGVYAADASIVVRIRDQAGLVVQKVSQRYELNGRLEELEAARRGEILFFRAPELPPGLYSVEAAVVDGAGARTSARVSTLEVPAADPDETRVSSVVLVRRSERVPADQQDSTNPLYVGDRLLYPNAGEALSRSVDRELTFYYTVYPRPSAPRAPSATIELLRSGRTLARMPVTLAQADRAGRIQQVSRLPLQPLPDGTYELRVLVDEGPRAVVRSTFFTVKS
jgi:VWFA-related protein